MRTLDKLLALTEEQVKGLMLLRDVSSLGDSEEIEYQEELTEASGIATDLLQKLYNEVFETSSVWEVHRSILADLGITYCATSTEDTLQNMPIEAALDILDSADGSIEYLEQYLAGCIETHCVDGRLLENLRGFRGMFEMDYHVTPTASLHYFEPLYVDVQGGYGFYGDEDYVESIFLYNLELLPIWSMFHAAEQETEKKKKQKTA